MHMGRPFRFVIGPDKLSGVMNDLLGADLNSILELA